MQSTPHLGPSGQGHIKKIILPTSILKIQSGGLKGLIQLDFQQIGILPGNRPLTLIQL